MIFYIDNDYKIHLTNPENLYEEISYDGDFFDGKCNEFIEGFRYVPQGRTWIRWDQVEFPGEMVAPWVDYVYLEHVQSEYMTKQLNDTINALSLLGIT